MVDQDLSHQPSGGAWIGCEPTAPRCLNGPHRCPARPLLRAATIAHECIADLYRELATLQADSEQTREMLRKFADRCPLGETQSVAYVIAAVAHVFALASEEERAQALVHEFVDAVRQGPHIQFAPHQAAGGRDRRIQARTGLAGAIGNYPRSRWTEAASAYPRTDFVTAAEALATAGAKPEEAAARVRAAEALAREGRRPEAEAQLEAALAFYRSVGAPRYLRENAGITSGATRFHPQQHELLAESNAPFRVPAGEAQASR